MRVVEGLIDQFGTDRREAAAEIAANQVTSLTYEQVSTWIDANVTDLASAKEVLKQLCKATIALRRAMLR